MFYRYEIKNNGVEDILYLYLTMNYEFSKELVNNSNDNELKRRTNNFIKNNGINFKGGKIYLVVDDIIVKAFEMSKEINDEKLYTQKSFNNLEFMVTLKNDDNSIVEITLEEFLLGALATNMIPNLSLDVLKAMAILYRGYAYLEMDKNKVVNAINDFFVYKPIDYYKLAFAPIYDEVVATLREAIRQTDCMFLTYQDQYIYPFIHISNFGYTLKDKRFPYLSSVSSPWDLMSPFYVDSINLNYEFLSKILGYIVSKDSEFKILEISPYGKVLKLSIAGNIIDGRKFIRLFHLKSQFFSIIVNTNNIVIVTRGFGDALGLSLFGSSQLADNGCSYANILNYYFPNTKICEYVKEKTSSNI